MKNDKIIFRASEVGALMVDGKGAFTEANARELEKLLAKVEAGPLTTTQAKQLEELLQKDGDLTAAQATKLAKLQEKAASDPLTPNQRQKLEELEAKAALGFQLSETAKNMVKRKWLRDELGYSEPVITDELQKGLLCEQDSLQLVTDVLGGFRAKNEERFRNGFFTGTPDTFSGDAVEDVKTAFSLRTFLQVKEPSKLYFAQLQAYMDLTGKKQARLIYCLVPTPEPLVERLEKRILSKYGWDEENKQYQQAAKQIRFNHIGLVESLPADKRVKIFTFERDEEYLQELKFRVEKAREYYNELTEHFKEHGFFEVSFKE